MKKIAFLLTFTALFGMVTLTSCKPKAAEPATESTEQVAPESAAAEEVPADTTTAVQQ